MEVLVYRIVAVVVGFLVAAVAVLAGLSGAPARSPSAAPVAPSPAAPAPAPAPSVGAKGVAAVVRDRLDLPGDASVDCPAAPPAGEVSCTVSSGDGSFRLVRVTAGPGGAYVVVAEPAMVPADVLAGELRDSVESSGVRGDYTIGCGTGDVVMADGVTRRCVLSWDGEEFGITVRMNDLHGYGWSFDPRPR